MVLNKNLTVMKAEKTDRSDSVTPVCCICCSLLQQWTLAESVKLILNQKVVQPPPLQFSGIDSAGDSEVSSLAGDTPCIGLGFLKMGRTHTFAFCECVETRFFSHYRRRREASKSESEREHETHVGGIWAQCGTELNKKDTKNWKKKKKIQILGWVQP